jgi:hypothetical protein
MKKLGKKMTLKKFVKAKFPHVVYFVDATEPIIITVTKADVRSAKKSYTGCAIAVSCKRQLNLDGAVVSLASSYLVLGDTATRYCVPQSISREVVANDRNGSASPGIYKLRPFSKSGRLGPRPRPKNYTGVPHSKRPPTLVHYTDNVRSFEQRAFEAELFV